MKKKVLLLSIVILLILGLIGKTILNNPFQGMYKDGISEITIIKLSQDLNETKEYQPIIITDKKVIDTFVDEFKNQQLRVSLSNRFMINSDYYYIYFDGEKSDTIRVKIDIESCLVEFKGLKFQYQYSDSKRTLYDIVNDFYEITHK